MIKTQACPQHPQLMCTNAWTCGYPYIAHTCTCTYTNITNQQSFQKFGSCVFMLLNVTFANFMHNSTFHISTITFQILAMFNSSFFSWQESIVSEIFVFYSWPCESRICLQLFLISDCIPYLNHSNKTGQNRFWWVVSFQSICSSLLESRNMGWLVPCL